MEVNIREAVKGDALRLNEMLSDLIKYEGTKYDPNTNPETKIKDFFERKIGTLGNYIFLAEADKKVVGFICASSNMNGIKLNLETKINFLFIDEEYRRKGIGTKLLEYYLKYAKEHGVKYVAINHYVDNIESESLYKKFGFKELTIDRRVEL